MKKVTQVLYSGLGGHGSVAFTICESDTNKKIIHQMIFIGVENVREEYKIKCKENNIRYDSILYQSNRKLYSIFLLLKTILRQRPDVVITHSDITAWIAPILILFGIRIIGVDHQANDGKSMSLWINTVLLNIFSKYQVFLTEDQWNDTKKRAAGYFMNFKKTRIINNGINVNLYSPDQYNPYKDTLNIFMAGRFMNTKDYSTIIRAVDSLNKRGFDHIRVYFAGDGDTLEECKTLSNSLKTTHQVFFLGMLDEKQLVEEFKKADLYVHSSLAETMSTAIMQALAVGVPCLVSDIPGNHAIIKDGDNGWLFKTQDPIDLSEKILQLYKQRHLLSEMSIKSRKYAEKHLSMEVMFEKYYQLIK